MDIKAKAQELIERISGDEKLQKKFKKDPIAAVEELIGLDLPNDQIEKIVDIVKAKLAIDDVGDLVEGLGKLFKK